MANQRYGTPSAGSQIMRHQKSSETNEEEGVSGLEIRIAWIKKKSAESPSPTTPRRTMPARRLPLSQTVEASHRKAVRSKIERARTTVCSKWAGLSSGAMLVLFVERHPLATPILHQGHPVLVPHNHPVERVDQRSTGASDLIIDGGLAQSPRRVDAPIGAAHRTFVVQVKARGDLLVGHALGHQLGHAQLVGFEQCARGLLVEIAHLLHAILDLWIDQATPVDRVPQKRHQHAGKEIVAFTHIGIVGENTGGAELAIILVIVLNRIEDHRHAWTLAPDRHGGSDPAHRLAGPQGDE